MTTKTTTHEIDGINMLVDDDGAIVTTIHLADGSEVMLDAKIMAGLMSKANEALLELAKQKGIH